MESKAVTIARKLYEEQGRGDLLLDKWIGLIHNRLREEAKKDPSLTDEAFRTLAELALRYLRTQPGKPRDEPEPGNAGRQPPYPRGAADASRRGDTLRGLYAECIWGGKLLGNATRAELLESSRRHRELAQPHLMKAKIHEVLADLIPAKDKRPIKDVVPLRRAEQVADKIRRGKKDLSEAG